MKKIGVDLTDCFSGPVFETRGREIGESWAKRKDKLSHPILENTGKMRKSFRYKTGRDSVEIYNVVDYFQYHQSNKPRRKIPRRIMMKLDDKRKTNIMKRLHTYLYRSLKAKGLWRT
jgi:phage gpG-like protein